MKTYTLTYTEELTVTIEANNATEAIDKWMNGDRHGAQPQQSTLVDIEADGEEYYVRPTSHFTFEPPTPKVYQYLDGDGKVLIYPKSTAIDREEKQLKTVEDFREAGYLSATEGTNFNVRLNREDTLKLLKTGAWDEKVFCREYGCDNAQEMEDGSYVYYTNEDGSLNPEWLWSALVLHDLWEGETDDGEPIYDLAEWWETFEVDTTA